MVSTRRKQQSTEYAVGDVVELMRVDGVQVGTLVAKKENVSPSARTGSPSSAQHWMVSVSDSETTIDMSEKYLGRILNGGASVSVTGSENSSLDETTTGATTMATLPAPADLPSSFSSPVIKMVVDGVTKTLDMNHGGDESTSKGDRSTSSSSGSRSNSPHGNNILHNKRRRVGAASSNLHKRNAHKANSTSTSRTVKHHNTRRNQNHPIDNDTTDIGRLVDTSVGVTGVPRHAVNRSPLASGDPCAKGILTTRHGKMVYKNPMATGVLYIYKDTHRAEFVRAK